MQFESPSGGSGVEPYEDPDPSLGIQGSLVRAAAIENAMRELVDLIENGGGLTPTRADLTQVRQAIAVMISGAVAAATLVAPGTIRWSAASSPEVGELLCNGAAVSRATYAALFAKIGTQYGAGDGSTTFNLPDARGRVPVCAGQGTGLALRSLGQTFGSEAVALSIAELPAHSHTVPSSSDGSASAGGTMLPRVEDPPNFAQFATSSVGSGAAHENMQPSLVLNAFIHI